MYQIIFGTMIIIIVSLIVNLSLKKEENTKIKISFFLLIFIAIIGAALIINGCYLIDQISFFRVSNRSSWIGFWGNIFGSIFGSAITLYVLIKTIFSSNQQHNKTMNLSKEIQKNSVKPYITGYKLKSIDKSILEIYLNCDSKTNNSYEFYLCNVGNGAALNLQFENTTNNLSWPITKDVYAFINKDNRYILRIKLPNVGSKENDELPDAVSITVSYNDILGNKYFQIFSFKVEESRLSMLLDITEPVHISRLTD